jgi:hypothetical protein
LQPQAESEPAVGDGPVEQVGSTGQDRTDKLPRPRFGHLQRLTNHLGVWEHAHFTTPRPEHGYCTDDNARALIVVCRQPEASAGLVQLAQTYLTFLEQAQLPGGGFHNRRRSDGAWVDEVGSDDSQGRALWALGSVADRGPTPSMRRAGLDFFTRSSEFASPYPRSNAYAVLGAAEMLRAAPEHEPARKILERCAGRIPVVSHDARWPWPEDRLAYDNARIPEALMAAGACTGDDYLLDSGLRLLEWLVGIETRRGYFSFAPVGGWAPGERRPGFDQQPIEAAAMADACSRAFSLTGDERWRDLVERAARWFVGDNDGEALLYDTKTGGGRDGLTPRGTNLNQGAESTLAALAALQQAQALYDHSD